MRKTMLLAFLLVLALGLTVSAVPQAADQTKAVDPVCKMTVTKANAKWTFDYKGTTYYFCSEGCKTSFSKEPEKYLAAAEAKKEEPKMMGGSMGIAGGMMGGHMQGQMQGKMQGQAADPTKAIDPVCKMTVTKEGAKWTYDYKGTTYYFCSEGCKTSFAKEPEKYLADLAVVVEGKPMMMDHTMMMGGRMQEHMQQQMQGQMPGMGMMMPHAQGMMGGRMGRMMRRPMGMMRGMRPGMRMPGMMQGPMGRMPGMMGGMFGPGPMMMEGLDKKVVNTKDGVVITLSSKDPETVKMLQERLAKMLEREKMMQERQAKMKEAQAAAKKTGEAECSCADCPNKKK